METELDSKSAGIKDLMNEYVKYTDCVNNTMILKLDGVLPLRVKMRRFPVNPNLWFINGYPSPLELEFERFTIDLGKPVCIYYRDIKSITIKRGR